MPINATPEYFHAEEKFRNAKTIDEKMIALEEMLRTIPKHKGTENVRAQLRSKLAKFRKEKTAAAKRRGSRVIGVKKEGDAQVCLLGKTMAGKSLILSKITNAKPKLAAHPFTTIEPAVGMMDWHGVLIQIVEIPATFESRYLSIARSADLVAMVARDNDEERDIEKVLADNFVRTKSIPVDPASPAEEIKRQLWTALGLMLVYTRARGKLSPMALKRGATVKKFCERIHKDFLKDFRFAFIWRGSRRMQGGLNYELKDGDVVELHTK